MLGRHCSEVIEKKSLERLKTNKYLGKDLAGAEPSMHRKCKKKILRIKFWKIK